MIHRPLRCAFAALLVGIAGGSQICDAVRLPAPIEDLQAPGSADAKVAVFAGGDFTTVEAVFRHVKGVSRVVVGYAGGTAATADHVMVDRGRTGHAEAVQMVFDPQQISYGRLLQVFFSVAHDPTELDRQGPDVGKQYRSVVFAIGTEQLRAARAYIAQLETAKAFARPIATQVQPLPAFYPAEGPYQNYAALNRMHPYVARYTLPRVDQLRDDFPELFVDN